MKKILFVVGCLFLVGCVQNVRSSKTDSIVESKPIVDIKKKNIICYSAGQIIYLGTTSGDIEYYSMFMTFVEDSSGNTMNVSNSATCVIRY